MIRRKSLLLVVLLLGPAAMSKAQTDKISEYSSSQGWHLWESPSVITIICQYTLYWALYDPRRGRLASP